MMNQIKPGKDVPAANLYKLIKWSLVFPPTFAAAPFFVYPSFGFIAIGFAYYFLAVYILPIAFAGFGFGYLVAKKRKSSQKVLHETIGYLAGFQVGFQLVAWLAVPNSASTTLVYLVALAMIGLVVAFYHSKIGAPQISVTNDAANSHPLGQIDSYLETSSQTQGLRIGIVFVLATIIGITISSQYIAAMNP